ncbi:MAG: sulfotransferase [Gammaproteobacteria bacterium]|nr:sulfotransferase [Gammaproteobacteria bacterium]
MSVLARAEQLLAEKQPDRALQLFDQCLQDTPDSVAAMIGRGRALNNLRQPAAAEAAFRQAVAAAPDNAVAQNFLGHVLRGQGKAAAARPAFEAAIAASPDYALAHYNLGTVLALEKDYAAAAAAFERGRELGHAPVPVLLNLAELYQFLERFNDAARCLQALNRDYPEQVAGWEAAGEFWYSLGEVQRAKHCYEEALRLDPGSPVALAGRGLLHELWGDIETGLELLPATSDNSLVRYARARLLRRQGQTDAALSILEELVARTDDLARDPRLYFTLGEVLDKLGRYDDAFCAFDHANAIKPAPFSIADHDAEVDRLIIHGNPAFFEHAARARTEGAMPVFIVGMPRSGTSLVEQILASHSAVDAGGERFELLQIRRDLQHFPQELAQFDEEKCNALRRRYRDSYGPIDDSKGAWTDKLPKNCFNLGLVAMLFPEARIIWCQRDPRDTGLSVYFQNMNFRSDPWTSRLDHIAAYTRSVERIMLHWSSVLPLPILPVRYEELVDNADDQVAAILGFLGLPFEPACLEFHRTRRLVNTASYAQVRKPLYRSSLQRWKNYDGHLGPLADLA